MEHQLTTTEIDAKLEVAGYLGTFACDELPENPKDLTSFSFVVNVDPSNEPGSHWLAVVFKTGIFYFIDSYGRSYNDRGLFPKLFIDIFQKYFEKSKVICNRKMLQQLVSNACGDYAIYFIREMSKNSFKKVLSVFSENLKRNDQIVVRYVKNV